MSASHRPSSLKRAEMNELYALPRFTYEDRHTYFELGNAEQQLIRARIFSIAAHLILQLRYFEARFQFFHYDPLAVADNLRCTLARQLPDEALTALTVRLATTRHPSLQHSIIDLLGFRPCERATRPTVE